MSEVCTTENKIARLKDMHTKYSSWVPNMTHYFNVLDAFQYTMHALLGPKYTSTMEHAWREVFTNIITLLSYEQQKQHQRPSRFKEEITLPRGGEATVQQTKKSGRGRELCSAISCVPGLHQLLPSLCATHSISPQEITQYSSLFSRHSFGSDNGPCWLEKSPLNLSSQRSLKKADGNASIMSKVDDIFRTDSNSFPVSLSLSQPFSLSRISVSNINVSNVTSKDSMQQSIYSSRHPSRKIIVSPRSERSTPVFGVGQAPSPYQMLSSGNTSVRSISQKSLSKDCLIGSESPNDTVDSSNMQKQEWVRPSVDSEGEAFHIVSAKHRALTPGIYISDSKNRRKRSVPILSPTGHYFSHNDSTELPGFSEPSRPWIYRSSSSVSSDSSLELPDPFVVPGVYRPLDSHAELLDNPDDPATRVSSCHDSFRPCSAPKIGNIMEDDCTTHEPTKHGLVNQDCFLPTNGSSGALLDLDNYSQIICRDISCKEPFYVYRGHSSISKEGSQSTRSCRFYSESESTDDGITVVQDRSSRNDTFALSATTSDAIPFLEQLSSRTNSARYILQKDVQYSRWTTGDSSLFVPHDMNTVDSLCEFGMMVPQRSETNSCTYLSTCPSMGSVYPSLAQAAYFPSSGALEIYDNSILRNRSANRRGHDDIKHHFPVSSHFQKFKAGTKGATSRTNFVPGSPSECSDTVVTDTLPLTPIHSSALDRLDLSACTMDGKNNSSFKSLEVEVHPSLGAPHRIVFSSLSDKKGKNDIGSSSINRDQASSASSLPVKEALLTNVETLPNSHVSNPLCEVVCTSENFALEEQFDGNEDPMVATIEKGDFEMDPLTISGGILQSMRNPRDGNLLSVSRPRSHDIPSNSSSNMRILSF